MDWLEFELAYYDIAVQHVCNYATGIPLDVLDNKTESGSHEVLHIFGFVSQLSSTLYIIWWILMLIKYIQLIGLVWFLCLICISTLFRLFNAKAILLGEQ